MAWSSDDVGGEANQASTVNRELDRLNSMLSKAVEWGKLLENPARQVQRLKVDNRRTRILTDGEQRSLLEACPRKLRAMATLALITGARIGELLALRWEDCADGFLTFLETKNGRQRRIHVSPTIQAVLDAQPRVHRWVFTNSRTEEPCTVSGVRASFDRAVVRAAIPTSDVTLHTLRHTALSRMIADGIDDYTVMAISGHSSTRMLARYTHPTEERKLGAFQLPWVSTRRAQNDNVDDDESATTSEIAKLLRGIGGPQEDRTPDLRIANAALSQLS
jgi:integrase